MNRKTTLEDFCYDFPEELIATDPVARAQSRLLLSDGNLSHHCFEQLPTLIPAALLVMNDSRVLQPTLQLKPKL